MDHITKNRLQNKDAFQNEKKQIKIALEFFCHLSSMNLM